MPRRLLLACILFLMPCPLWATPASQGVTVEIDAFEYSYYLGGDEWSMRCRYRIDGGEWRAAAASGSGADRELRFPGTTVRVGDPGDRSLQWNHEGDVRELRFDQPPFSLQQR
jgi:hypothetical protein